MSITVNQCLALHIARCINTDNGEVTSTIIGSDVALDVNIAGGSVTVGGAGTPNIYNVPVGTTEVSQALTANTKKLTMRARGNADLQVAFASGQSIVTWFTIPSGCSWSEDMIDFSGTLYFVASKAGQTCEILEWS